MLECTKTLIAGTVTACVVALATALQSSHVLGWFEALRHFV